VKCIWVKFKWVGILTIVAKGNEGLRNRVSIIIRIYIDHIKFAVYRVVSFISFYIYTCGSILYYCICGCLFFFFFFFFMYFMMYSCLYVSSFLDILFQCVVFLVFFVGKCVLYC
jgi:hypothetical protein